MEQGVAPAAPLLALSPHRLHLDQELLLKPFTQHLVLKAIKPKKQNSAETKAAPDLLVVRILNQLLGVIQLSQEVVLRRSKKTLRSTLQNGCTHSSTAETDTSGLL